LKYTAEGGQSEGYPSYKNVAYYSMMVPGANPTGVDEGLH
jgi:hypothetical protein